MSDKTYSYTLLEAKVLYTIEIKKVLVKTMKKHKARIREGEEVCHLCGLTPENSVHHHLDGRVVR